MGGEIDKVEWSVILPAYNEEALLEGSISSITVAMDRLGESWECIVVDNASTDRTAEIARNLGAKVVFEPINQIARARNAGAKNSQGKWLLFLDADTEVDESLPEVIQKSINIDGLVGGGVPIGFVGEIPWSARMMVGAWNWLARIANLAAGSLVFVDREAFLEVDGFPNDVYAGEEVHLSRKLKKWGKQNRRPFRHLGHAPPVKTSARKLEWHSHGKIWFIHSMLAVCPPLMRSKKFCSFWYQRPD